MRKHKCTGPIIHPAIAFILSQKKGAKYIYDVLLRKLHIGHTHTWENKWNAKVGQHEWSDTYKNIFQATKSAQYRALHYKIITMTAATNVLLNQIGVKDTSLCSRCEVTHETIYHKYWACPDVQIFWREIKQWLSEIGAAEDANEFNLKNIIFGNGGNKLINHVIISGKLIIKRGRNLNIEIIKALVTCDRATEEEIARLDGSMVRFQQKWETFGPDADV